MTAFFEILDTRTTLHDAARCADAGELSGAARRSDHVFFSYNGHRRAVSDVTFDVNPGETIALVGSTGSGKSTTLGLLHRAFDPSEGRIVADGRDIRTFSLTSASPQHRRRVPGADALRPLSSIRRENLLVGKPDASEEQLRAALERAQAIDIIEHQAHGLDTVVGEQGVGHCPGGERQRLSIARALLKDPPILILDEATSALDAETEQKAEAAPSTKSPRSAATTVIIAHRLATVRDATRILVLDHGRIVETGSFDELVESQRPLRGARARTSSWRRQREHWCKRREESWV